MNRIQTAAVCLMAPISMTTTIAHADIAVFTQHMQFVEDASNPYSGMSVTVNVGMDLGVPDLDPAADSATYEFGTPTITINAPSGGFIVFLATREGEMNVEILGGLSTMSFGVGADWIDIDGIGVGSNMFGPASMDYFGFSGDIFGGGSPEILPAFEGVVSGDFALLQGGMEINGSFHEFIPTGEAAELTIIPAPSALGLLGCGGLFASRRRR